MKSLGMFLLPLCSCLAAQTATAAAISDSVLYRAFFAKVASWQRLAQKETAKGIANGPAKNAIKKDAGLTDSEDASLESIVTDYRAGLQALDQRSSQLAAQYRPPNSPPPSVQQQLNLLYEQRQQLISDHMNQLKTAFGPSRFAILDAYVRSTILPTFKASSTPGPAAPGK